MKVLLELETVGGLGDPRTIKIVKYNGVSKPFLQISGRTTHCECIMPDNFVEQLTKAGIGQNVSIPL